MVPQYVGHHHHLGISASHYEPRSQQATSLRIPIISLVNRSKLKSIKGRALSWLEKDSFEINLGNKKTYHSFDIILLFFYYNPLSIHVHNNFCFSLVALFEDKMKAANITSIGFLPLSFTTPRDLTQVRPVERSIWQ
jgi:hypothetical protein